MYVVVDTNAAGMDTLVLAVTETLAAAREVEDSLIGYSVTTDVIEMTDEGARKIRAALAEVAEMHESIRTGLSRRTRGVK